MMRLPLSVVVPTRDRPGHLRRCLASMAPVLGEGDELIVVDSASLDPAVREIAADFGAVVVRCDRPGTSLARNSGASAARHHLVAFVDDDVQVGPGWADAMVAALTREGVAFVCGRVAVPPGQVGGLRQIAIKDDDEPAVLDATTPAPLGCSANLGMRVEVLRAVGSFDEGLGGGARFRAAEDLDLFDRLLGAGHRGWYEPAALAWHDQWRTRAQLVRLDWSYGIGLGARLAKLARTDRRRLRRALAESMWSDGLRVVGEAIRHRHEFLVATTSARLVSTVFGFGIALPATLQRGCFRATAVGRTAGCERSPR